jgi:CspA family cold shock protein
MLKKKNGGQGTKRGKLDETPPRRGAPQNNFRRGNIFSRTFVPAHCQRSLFSIFFMHTGTVKFFNETKGFGFIVDDATQEEFFVHVTGLVDKIREGDKVEFELTRGKKGMNAVDVKVS